MSPLIAQNLPQIQQLCRRYGVERMFVFGSAARGEDFSADSDVDLLYRMAPQTEELLSQVGLGQLSLREELLAREVSLIAIDRITNPTSFKP